MHQSFFDQAHKRWTLELVQWTHLKSHLAIREQHLRDTTEIDDEWKDSENRSQLSNEKILNQLHLKNEHSPRDRKKAPREKRQEYGLKDVREIAFDSKYRIWTISNPYSID